MGYIPHTVQKGAPPQQSGKRHPCTTGAQDNMVLDCVGTLGTEGTSKQQVRTEVVLRYLIHTYR